MLLGSLLGVAAIGAVFVSIDGIGLGIGSLIGLIGSKLGV